MSRSVPDHTQSLASLLERVGVTKSSVIRITGSSALPALLRLCRQGYEQVGYIRAGEGSPHEEPDAIIAAHTCDELDLKRVLQVGRQVRAGGVFIFQVKLAKDQDLLGIEWLVESAGFAIEWRIEHGRRALIVARRRTWSMQRAA